MRRHLYTLCLLFSCIPIRYLQKPISDYPNIELNSRIIIAKDKVLNTKSLETDMCFEGLVSNIGKGSIRIIDRINFHEKVDYVILNEIKSRYNVDGLLLLTNIYNSSNEDIIGTWSLACVGCPINYKVDLFTEVTTYWEYYDFVSGNTYAFMVSIDKDEKTTYQDKNIEAYNNYKLKVLEDLLYANGRISSDKLIGR